MWRSALPLPYRYLLQSNNFTKMKKKAIALLINDIHVSKDTIFEFEKNWLEMLDVCRKNKISEVVVGGDMFTSRASQTLSTLLTVKAALDKAVQDGVYITIAEGNHDLVDTEAIEGYNHLFAGLQGVEIVDVAMPMTWDGVDFMLMPFSYFPEDGTFLDKLDAEVTRALKDYSEFKRGDIILYLHEGVHGALGDFEIDGELPQEPLAGFRAVLCGHYHNRVKIKGTNIEYIGASRQHNFGEDEEKGYTILYSDGSYEFVKNEVNTRYKTVELDAKEVDKYQLDADERYKYKVKVKCDERQAKLFDKQKLVGKGFHKVEVVAASPVERGTAVQGISEKYDKEGIKREYQNYCDENSIDSELGMKYLS